MDVHSIAALVHGRYLVDRPDDSGPFPILVGFHGYAERGEHMLEVLQRIRGDRRWLLVSVQALNRFYTRSQEVVGSWMTREDRELAIADNIAYVAAVVAAVRRDYPTTTHVVYAGFSQGVAMAYRALAFAAAGADAGRQSVAPGPGEAPLPGLKPGPAGVSQPGLKPGPAGVARHPGPSEHAGGPGFSPGNSVPAAVGGILLAGDVPPDVAPRLASLPPLLIGRGTTDDWYTESKAAADLVLFAAAGLSPQVHVFEGGHLWDASFITAAGHFLDRTLEP
jgi:predicted esterase